MIEKLLFWLLAGSVCLICCLVNWIARSRAMVNELRSIIESRREERIGSLVATLDRVERRIDSLKVTLDRREKELADSDTLTCMLGEKLKELSGDDIYNDDNTKGWDA
jgi:hypothetical protein